MSSTAITRRPDECRGAESSFAVPAASRRAARSRRIDSSARTRPSLRVRRALMPWRIQTSSCASLRSNVRVRLRFGVRALLAAAQVIVVVAGPAGDAAAIDLDDARRQLAQEPAIVRDEHETAGEAEQHLLRAMRSPRCRDGSSARRAAARRARSRAHARAARGASCRPRATRNPSSSGNCSRASTWVTR